MIYHLYAKLVFVVSALAIHQLAFATTFQSSVAVPERQAIRVADYNNPMNLDLEMLGEVKKSDYYKSSSARKWAREYHMEPAYQKMQQRNFESAFREFQFVLKYVPNHPRALSLLGDMAIKLHRTEEADVYFKEAMKAYPETFRAPNYKDYGRFLYQSGKYPKAIEILNKSLKIDPNLTEARYYLGLTFFATNDYTSANAQAQKVYAKDFPFTELKEKLMGANAWSPGDSGTQKDGPNKAGGQ